MDLKKLSRISDSALDYYPSEGLVVWEITNKVINSNDFLKLFSKLEPSTKEHVRSNSKIELVFKLKDFKKCLSIESLQIPQEFVESVEDFKDNQRIGWNKVCDVLGEYLQKIFSSKEVILYETKLGKEVRWSVSSYDFPRKNFEISFNLERLLKILQKKYPIVPRLDEETSVVVLDFLTQKDSYDVENFNGVLKEIKKLGYEVSKFRTFDRTLGGTWAIVIRSFLQESELESLKKAHYLFNV